MREKHVVHVDCAVRSSVPEEFLYFFSNRELSTLFVKFSVKVREVICRPVNHITWVFLLHGYNIAKYIKQAEILCNVFKVKFNTLI